MTKGSGDADRIRELERRRCHAMVDADLAELDRLFHRELCWVHGSGREQGREDLLRLIGDERPYRDLILGDVEVREIGAVSIAKGVIEIVLDPTASPDRYANVFTNIWVTAEGDTRLVHAQSTRFAAPKGISLEQEGRNDVDG